MRWSIALFALAGTAHALPNLALKPDEVPPALRDWQKWVLHDETAAPCPFLQSGTDRVCVWPGRLELKLDEKGGSFHETLRAYRDEWVPLPGDARRWPQSVKLDGKDAVITTKDDKPVVRVTPGEHNLVGQFLWEALPEALGLPRDTALLSLSVRGKLVPMPDRDEEGRVFLQKESTAQESENLELTVSRRLTDEIPFTLWTRIELNISGKSREVLLGRALPADFIPMSVSSGLPVRVESDGRIRLQVRPGTWTVDLVAYRNAPVTRLTRPNPDGPWGDGDEVWVFEARPSLRQVLVEGVNAVDPTQTRLPADWKRLPAYAVGAKDTVQLTERRRGDADPAPDELTLTRQLWLDFDGRGMTVSDKISGQLHRSWRLDMLPRTELGRVVTSGSDQSITRLGPKQPAGVELRLGNLSLEADSRITGDVDEIPAVSWDADFHQVSGTLELPPGWRLFHASGADDVSDTWVHGWTLLDIFLVLVIGLAIGRLFGAAWGGLALLTLILSFNEESAPQFIWLAVLVGEALVRVLPQHWVKSVARIYRLGTWALLVVISVGFMVEHVRHGMYPALEQERQLGGVQSFNDYSNDNAAQYQRNMVNLPVTTPRAEKKVDALDEETLSAGEAAPAAPAPAKPEPPVGGNAQQAISGKLGKTRSFNVRDYDKNAMVQTGPGVPRWNWTSVRLGFSGPVQRTQTLKLWLLSPAVNLALAFVRVLLLGLLILCLLGFPGSFWPKSWRRAGAVALGVLLFGFGSAANAEERAIPDAALLQQLKDRLLKPPTCAPTCASSPRLELQATQSQLRMRMEVLAGAETAVPLPGNAQHWIPDHVFLDGKPAAALLRDNGGTVWIAVTEGAHQLLLDGALPASDTVQIALPFKPRRVEAKLDGWTLDGLHEDGLADNDLQLSRKARSAGGHEPRLPLAQAEHLPPFVRVERTLVLGLQWTVETRVERLTPTGSAVVLEVPLLPGESVTTVDVRVQDGKALVNMGASATEASWTSVLQEKSPIELHAPKDQLWVEVWKLDVSPVWHVQPSGIPVVHQQDAQGVRLPEWHPWPGESVTVEVTKPDGVPGQTFTIDQSVLRVAPGVRATDATLTFNLRSSHGGLHTLQIPDDAQLQNVTINGSQQPIRQDGNKVAIPLLPGSQSVQLSWRQTSGIRGLYETPAVQLGTASVNADVELVVPRDRWVLLVRGPRMGPAVLFWSFFLVLLLVSIGLARIPWTPLRTHHWVLLALGLSQVPIYAAAVVFGWLLLVGWRQKQVDVGGVRRFDARQIIIIGVTVVAMIILMASIYKGLLGRPEMQVSGNGSSGSMLRWFQDRTAGGLPRGWVLSVPMLVYRGAMLAWSLWLALALLRWLRWAWTAFTTGGAWKRRSPPSPPAPPTPPATPSEPSPI